MPTLKKGSQFIYSCRWRKDWVKKLFLIRPRMLKQALQGKERERYKMCVWERQLKRKSACMCVCFAWKREREKWRCIDGSLSVPVVLLSSDKSCIDRLLYFYH